MSSVPEHANQDIVLGLEHSCNYFFYEVAHRTGVDNLVKWGEQFGLTSTTGIELTGEAVGAIGNQETLYDKTKSIDNQKDVYKRQELCGAWGCDPQYHGKL